uniref:Uncharacterized protein n=1 Tax=Lactuca sativa TaxID=4236 RepID=A0A9R1XL91_LACSA|nr:hypothetical protein LSAT_V11C400223320 [Lactuca sativa]
MFIVRFRVVKDYFCNERKLKQGIVLDQANQMLCQGKKLKVTKGVFDEFDEILNEKPGGITHESEDRDDADDSDDREFIVDLDNFLDEPEIVTSQNS